MQDSNMKFVCIGSQTKLALQTSLHDLQLEGEPAIGAEINGRMDIQVQPLSNVNVSNLSGQLDGSLNEGSIAIVVPDPAIFLLSAKRERVALEPSLEQLTDCWVSLCGELIRLVRGDDNHVTLLSLSDIQRDIKSFSRDYCTYGVSDQPPSYDLIDNFESELAILCANLTLINKEKWFSSYDELLSHCTLITPFDPHYSPIAEEVAQSGWNMLDKFNEVTRVKFNEITLEKDQFRTVNKRIAADLELSNLQIAQLIEEAESIESKNVAQSEEIINLKAELEISDMQVSRSQADLERHYELYRAELDRKKVYIEKLVAGPVLNVFENARATCVTIIGSYAEEHYKDLKLKVSDLILADGRIIDQLEFKLFSVGQYIGIEVRQSQCGDMFCWYEEFVDDYGPYLKVLFNSPQELQEKNSYLFGKLSASEKLVLMSLPSVINQAMKIGGAEVGGELLSEDLRYWSMMVDLLVEDLQKFSTWLSFDSVALVEESQSDNYEHLWLRLENLLLSNCFWPEFEFKISARNIIPDPKDEYFTESIFLEFRQSMNGSKPLLSWPPQTSDEHGPYFTIGFAKGQSVDLSGGISTLDAKLLHHIIKNLNGILYRVEPGSTSRPLEQWTGNIESVVNFNDNTIADNITNYRESNVQSKSLIRAIKERLR